MKIQVVNGPNLNLLGKREPEIYGNQTLQDLENLLVQTFPQVNFEFFQSNHEGEIVDALQKADSQADGIIVNAAGYSHTSVAIADAFAAVSIPKIEVHISNIYRREKFRHQSLLAPHANGIIIGIGFKGYLLAAQAIVS